MLQFRPRLVDVHFAEREDGVPERKPPPSVLAVAHGSQVQRAARQALLMAIEPAGEQIPPPADAALAATEQTRIAAAWVFGGAHETLPDAVVSRLERANDG